jgi:hypothetical protein
VRVLRDVTVQLALKDLDQYDWKFLSVLKRKRKKVLDEATHLVHWMDRVVAERKRRKVGGHNASQVR